MRRSLPDPARDVDPVRERALRVDRAPIVWHAFAAMAISWHTPPVMLDFSGEHCASSVRRLSTLTRPELEAFLEATARASARVVRERARRPKPAKIVRSPRASWR